MKLSRQYFLIPIILTAFGLLSCERQGAAERAGERIDRAVDKTGDSIERAGERAHDTANR